MKKRLTYRLRSMRTPLRTAAVCGVATMVAVPASVAIAGTEDRQMQATSVEIGSPGAFENAETLDLIPESEASELTLNAGTADAVDAELIGSGEASWYGPRFAGRQTANGETFNPSELTAAHRTLPFGSRVRVTNENTGKSVIVRINDRGPYHGNRVIDLSEAAAKEIGIKRSGRGHVELALLAS